MIGRQMRGIRKELGLTQEQLAAAVGVHQSQLSSWERDKNTPSLEALVKLAEVLGCSLDRLVHGEEHELSQLEDPDIIHIVERLKALPAADRSTIREIADTYHIRRRYEAIARDVDLPDRS